MSFILLVAQQLPFIVLNHAFRFRVLVVSWDSLTECAAQHQNRTLSKPVLMSTFPRASYSHAGTTFHSYCDKVVRCSRRSRHMSRSSEGCRSLLKNCQPCPRLYQGHGIPLEYRTLQRGCMTFLGKMTGPAGFSQPCAFMVTVWLFSFWIVILTYHGLAAGNAQHLASKTRTGDLSIYGSGFHGPMWKQNKRHGLYAGVMQFSLATISTLAYCSRCHVLARKISCGGRPERSTSICVCRRVWMSFKPFRPNGTPAARKS